MLFSCIQKITCPYPQGIPVKVKENQAWVGWLGFFKPYITLYQFNNPSVISSSLSNFCTVHTMTALERALWLCDTTWAVAFH